MLGFAITNSGDNFDISSLSKALINNKVHPDIYITFGFYEEWPIDKMIRLSDLSICSDIYGVVLATISYHIGPWQISVSYWAARGPQMPLIEHGFHPTKINKIVYSLNDIQ